MSDERQWFRDASVRTKILGAFGVVLFFMVVVGVLVLVQAGRIDGLQRQNASADSLTAAADQLDEAMTDEVSAFRSYLLSGDASDLQSYRTADDAFGSAISAAHEIVQDPAQSRQLDELQRAHDAWTSEVAEPGIALRTRTGLTNDTVGAFFRGAPRGTADRTMAALSSFEARRQEAADRLSTDLEASLRRIRLVIIALTLLAAVLGGAVAVWAARMIARPLSRAVDFAAAVAAGDLTTRIPVESRDEIGRLAETMNRMAEDLHDAVSKVNVITEQVASAAEQIAASSEEILTNVDEQVNATEESSSSLEEIAAQISRVAQNAEALAASVDQTSSSITEMGQSIERTASSAETLGTSVEQTSATIAEMVASINQVARHVEETRGIARAAAEDAEAGGEAVSRSGEGMRRVHHEMMDLKATIDHLLETSDSIGRVSGLIEDIADQTNLLALNASIEAARAGEHGRGFSVVAQEIRRLAERSVEAAREIGGTIGEVAEEVQQVAASARTVAERTEDGIGLADEAGEALEKIVTSAGRTRQLMSEVATATEEQIRAAGQTGEAAEHIQRIADETLIANREQAEASRQIISAVEDMNRQTQDVFAATSEQKKGGDLILRATENISEGARSTRERVQEMTKAARDLSRQASSLSEAVNRFRV